MFDPDGTEYTNLIDSGDKIRKRIKNQVKLLLMATPLLRSAFKRI